MEQLPPDARREEIGDACVLVRRVHGGWCAMSGAGYPVRRVQLGLVPTLSRALSSAYPAASTSLWQRDAKRNHRRIMAAAPVVGEDSPARRRLCAVYTIAALLVAFHEAAPQGVRLTELDFADLVGLAASTPIAAMLLSGGDLYRDEDARDLADAIEGGRGGGPGRWEGEVRALGSHGPDDPVRFSVEVSRCGLLDLCVREKRLYLLKHLCLLEEALVGMSGCRLEFGRRIALGSSSCELTVSR